MGSCIIISHGPGNRKKAEEEREASWRPSGCRVDICEDVLRVVPVFTWCFGQKSNGTGYQDENMEDNVGLCHLLHPVGRQRVYESGKKCKCGHHADGSASCREPREVCPDRHGSKQHRSGAVFGRSHTSDLSKQIDPSDHPTDTGDPFSRCQTRHSVV